MTVEAGDLAPDFDLPANGGSSVKLSDLRGKKVVLFFYPKAMTSGFTQRTIRPDAPRKLAGFVIPLAISRQPIPLSLACPRTK